MSHFEDVEPLFWGDGPKTRAGCFLFAIVAGLAVAWSIVSDNASADICKSHGEKYVDSRSAYTLCEKPDGTVVRR